MQNHSIRGSSFNLPANRHLWKTLGAYDALVEFIECSCRVFLNKYKISGDNFKVFLTKESEEVGIYLRDLSLANYRCITNKSYLIYPYACFDKFIFEFIKDVRKIIDVHFQLKQKDDATNFERLLDALKELDIKPNISKAKKDLFDYYRLVRNSIAHKGDADLKNAFKKINKIEIKEIYPTLSEPQLEENIGFDDFILCTANIKNIADILTVSLETYVKWNEIGLLNKELFPKYNTVRFNLKRSKIYIQNCIRSEYGVYLEDAIYDKMMGSLE